MIRRAGAISEPQSLQGPVCSCGPTRAMTAPSAVSLALLAGAPHANSIGAALSSSLDESSAQAPGDQLLALEFFASQQSGK